MPKKLMRCVRKVKAKNKGRKKKVNPWAVCIKSTGQKPHKRKQRKKPVRKKPVRKKRKKRK